PMARPGMASVAIFNFLGLWNQFLLPVALNTNTKNYVLSQGMASFASQAGYGDLHRVPAAVAGFRLARPAEVISPRATGRSSPRAWPASLLVAVCAQL